MRLRKIYAGPQGQCGQNYVNIMVYLLTLASPAPGNNEPAFLLMENFPSGDNNKQLRLQ